MMIMASWMRAVASGCRPIACIAPWPIRPRPMPEPIAAMPMPSGRPSASAAWKFMGSSWVGLERALRHLLVLVIVVREHEEDVDRAEHGEDQGLERAGEQCQEQEGKLERQAERQVRE